MASSTWEGWTLPEEQAEPEETATPSRSKPITAVSALRPGAVNSVVFGSRGTSAQNTRRSAVCRSPFSRRSRKPSNLTASPLSPAHRCLHGGAKACDPRNILRSGAAPQLLAATTQQRLEPCEAVAQNQRADALGAADLVRRQRHQIGTYHLDIEWYFSKRLDRIDMQEGAGGMYNFGRPLPPAGPPRSRYWLTSPRPARESLYRAAYEDRSRSTTPDWVTPTVRVASAVNRPPESTEACSIADTTSLCTG